MAGSMKENRFLMHNNNYKERIRNNLSFVFLDKELCILNRYWKILSVKQSGDWSVEQLLNSQTKQPGYFQA